MSRIFTVCINSNGCRCQLAPSLPLPRPYLCPYPFSLTNNGSNFCSHIFFFFFAVLLLPHKRQHSQVAHMTHTPCDMHLTPATPLPTLLHGFPPSCTLSVLEISRSYLSATATETEKETNRAYKERYPNSIIAAD